MVTETCTTTSEPFPECGDENGNNGNENGNTCFDGICIEVRDGLLCPIDNPRSPWSLTENSSDACLADSYINEQLNIAGADVNIYKLLGIHEQGLLVDLTGDGDAISNGSHPNFPPIDAFNMFKTEWRSSQLGQNVITNAFIGYDFGEIRLDNGRLRYGIETFVKHNITRVRIKQGCDTINKVTRVRLERSHDGERWFGVGIVAVADCDGIVTLDFPASVPSRYWRLRPVSFSGGQQDYWAVQALQMIDYEKTNINNIQDKVYMENRDRDYAEFPEKLKGAYSPIDSQSFFAKMGVFEGGGGGGQQYFIDMSWSEVVRVLGRPIVIGDILQLPSETEYTAALVPVLKYVTVSDVGWSPNGYSPQWTPLMVRIVAEPSIASPETQQIFGKLTEDYDEMGLADTGDGVRDKKYQDISDVDHTIRAKANDAVPETGSDDANVTQLSQDAHDWAARNPNADLSNVDRRDNVWTQSGMPPNGLPYTQADDFPTSPKNDDYHRLTYTNIRQGIPARLYRYSSDKSNWVYLETDRRAYNKVIRSQLQEFVDPEKSSVTPPQDIDDAYKK
jgi:hypothetical protein